MHHVLFFSYNLIGGDAIICPEELILSISALAIAISKDKSVDEINLLAAIITQLGDTLATISTQKDCLESSDKK